MAAGSILNNISALGASRQLGITSQGMEKTIQRLTTGKRINMAADDAAGLAISNKLGADIRVAVQARRNAYDGIAMLAVADGVLDEVTSLLTRATELTEQARTGTISSQNRAALDLEFQKILSALDNVAKNTKFNGQTVFAQIGGDAVKTYVSLAAFTKEDISISTMHGADLSNDCGKDGKYTLFQKSDNSDDYIKQISTVRGKLETTLQGVSMQRAQIGSQMQNLYSYANTLGIEVENYTAAFSQIRDANIADEVISLTKFQILNQSGTSALGQANQAAQSVLSLLR